jgi:uncharacterized protein YceK
VLLPKTDHFCFHRLSGGFGAILALEILFVSWNYCGMCRRLIVSRHCAICMRNLVVMLSFLTLMCSGCAFTAGHDDQGTMGGVDLGVYRGVRTEWQWIAHSEPEESMGMPLYCIDMPFSFVADTLWFPFDAVASMKKPETGKPDAK